MRFASILPPLAAMFLAVPFGLGQAPPLLTRDGLGGYQLSLPSRVDSYYVLFRSDDLRTPGLAVAFAPGSGERITLTDPRAPGGRQAFYRWKEIPLSAPEDTDKDGINDWEEWGNLTKNHPLNSAKTIDPLDGTHFIESQAEFEFYAGKGEINPGSGIIPPHESFVKFTIVQDSKVPTLYFVNMKRYWTHGTFISKVTRVDKKLTDSAFRGEIAYRASGGSGVGGAYTFQYQPGDAHPFATIQRTFELISQNLPIARGRLSYFAFDPTTKNRYLKDKALYEAANIPVVTAQAISKDFTPLNAGTGYGRLVLAEEGVIPSPFDIVIYRNLPLDIPLVRGVITEVPQTPLSHINLRAIQNKIPNVFIREVTGQAKVMSLIGKWVTLGVDGSGYKLLEVSKSEALAKLESLRPPAERQPESDLTVTKIRPLSEIKFEDSKAFGPKTANVGEMRNLNKTVRANNVTYKTMDPGPKFSPDGFGVPFWFYHEFMRHNGFPERVRQLIGDEAFISGDPAFRDKRLESVRNMIKKGTMPSWMMDALAALQASFPADGSIRCRSSTNNEDLPGFNGAGLYSSFTHYPKEGHLSKTIQQVYASLWNLNAFEHREFYRVDHFAAKMGVLVHPNSDDEQANGVAVSKDIYSSFTQGTIGEAGSSYINAQVGEQLVTNPEGDVVPEVWIVSNNGVSQRRLLKSNLVPDGVNVLSKAQITLLDRYLAVLHTHFRGKYGRKSDDPTWAIEVEFKFGRDGSLLVKQARPWVQ